ncbi:MAG: hypothetical protein AAGP08_19320, partial [Pseudomonadota bacterium]
ARKRCAPHDGFTANRLTQSHLVVDSEELVDSILYDSADSYAQARLLYLERRRFELGGNETTGGGEIDPYADFGGIDPYGD